jgi:phytoene dehydrogenase-like protein
MINEGSIQASLFRTTTIDVDLGLSSRYGLRQRVIDPAHVQMQLDGASLALWRDPHKVAAELRHFSRRDADAYLKLFEIIDAAVQMGLPAMQTNPTRPEAKAVLKSLSVSKCSSTASACDEAAERATSPILPAWRPAFDIIKAALMIGLPFMSYHADGSGWALIYLGVLSKYGVAMFEGGTGAFPKALVSCLQDHGGTVRTSAKVESLTQACERRGTRMGARARDRGATGRQRCGYGRRRTVQGLKTTAKDRDERSGVSRRLTLDND